MRVRLTGLHAFDSCQSWYRYFHFIYEERAPGRVVLCMLQQFKIIEHFGLLLLFIYVCLYTMM